MDDDAKANPKYIEILTQILHEHKPDICGGPHYPFYHTPKPKWFIDRYGSGCFYGDMPRYLTPREYFSGMNIVFRGRLFDEMGWFDPNLGMTGKKLCDLTTRIRICGPDGQYSFAWNTQDLAPGIYMAAFRNQHIKHQKKLVLLK